MYDRQWTVGDVFGLDPARYHDVGRYATYEVTVSFRGKSRTYRALALFHNAHGSDEPLKPDFWDSIVGMGGVLNNVWAEKRPPVGEKTAPAQAEGAGRGAPGEDAPREGLTPQSSEASPPPTESYSETNSVSSTVVNKTENGREHASGSHGLTVHFRGECAGQPNNQQVCNVNVLHRHTWESGTTTNWVYTHVLMTDDKDETGSGPRGELITCTATRGIAVSNCLSRDCVYTASLSGSGTSVSMTGGDVWNGQVAHKHTCREPSPTPTPAPQLGCTRQGSDGSCPDGTYPDGSGMCCSGGSCNGAAALTATGDAAGDAPSTNMAPGPFPGPGACGCDPAERTGCYSGGGEWSETYCSCVSPVLVDVDGDGFDLTDGARGVPFDITADGVPDRISWTVAGADDAWLALDRDGDGTIESGAELFGNFTPQPAPPAGEQRNGFLALSVYDRAGNGGNEDSVIDERDAVYSALRLWQDVNHNGVSEAEELHTLRGLGLKSLELDYKESKRTDEHGNRFRYRAKVTDVRGVRLGRWAWDVYLVKAP